MLTSASVHPGSSGGPVVRVRDGALLGILTSFTQCCDDDGKIVVAHPTLNFVVSAIHLLRVCSVVSDMHMRGQAQT